MNPGDGEDPLVKSVHEVVRSGLSALAVSGAIVLLLLAFIWLLEVFR